jgi:hypothetical protein
MDLSHKLKSSGDDSRHKAKIAWKAGGAETAASPFESPAKAMF